jgi:hypothetical protein
MIQKIATKTANTASSLRRCADGCAVEQGVPLAVPQLREQLMID